MSGKRQKIPIGGSSFFVLTDKTARYEIDGAGDTPSAELLVNANGNGAVVLVPPGVKLAPGSAGAPLDPIDAVELLRRVNLYRLSRGKPEHRIPAALLRRARAMELPGMEALVPFPGKLKTFYRGRGSWDGTGLWATADGEFSLEMRAAAGFLRKMLTRREAELWLDANGIKAWDTINGPGSTSDAPPDAWRIATAGDPGAGHRSLWAISWAAPPEEPPPTRAAQAREAKLRESLKQTRSVAPPEISPPRKRRPRRGK